MSQIIEARVFQKVDTLANWMANTLVLGKGEQAFVKSDLDDTPIVFKIGDGVKKFSELPYPDFSVRGKATTAAVWDGSKASGVYIPVADGTYNGIAVTLSDGYQILFWDGTTLIKVIYPLSLSGYLQTSTFTTNTVSSSNQLYNKSAMTLATGFVISGTNGLNASQSGGIIIRIPVNPALGGGKVSYFGIVGLGITGAKGYRFSDSAGVLVPGAFGNESASVALRTLTIPATAAFLDLTAKLGADTDTNPLDNIMVNYGTSSLPYEDFGTTQFLTKITPYFLEAYRLRRDATIASPGTSDTSVPNNLSVKGLIAVTKKPTNLALIDRWLDGYKLLQVSGSPTIYTSDDGLQNVAASTVVNLVDSLTNGFSYDGKSLSVLATRSSFFYSFRTPKIINDINFLPATPKTTLNVEIKSLASLSIIPRLWRVTGGGTTVTEIITEQTISVTAGVVTKIQFKDFDILGGHTAADVPSFHLRFHTQSGANFTAAIIIGRITISNIATDDLEFDNDEPRIVQKKYNISTSGNTSKPIIKIWGDSFVDEVNVAGSQVPFAVPMRLLMPDRTILTNGYAGYKSAQIRDKFFADMSANPQYLNATSIFWPGRNDLAKTGWPYIVLDIVKSMVNTLGHSRFLVGNPASDASGTNDESRATISNAEGIRYKDILLYESLCLQTFGSRFVNMRKALVEKYDFGGVSLTNAFTQPASGANVQIAVNSTSMFSSGVRLRIGFFPSDPMIGGFADVYTIQSIDSATLMTIRLDDEVGIPKRITSGNPVDNLVDTAALPDGFSAKTYLKVVTAIDYQDHNRDITPGSGRVDLGHTTTKMMATVTAPEWRNAIEAHNGF